jgi:hypothetical protein
LRGTEAVVDFLIAARGPEVFRDVLGCSLRARGAPTDCGKICRSTSVASFGAVNGEASVSG